MVLENDGQGVAFMRLMTQAYLCQHWTPFRDVARRNAKCWLALQVHSRVDHHPYDALVIFSRSADSFPLTRAHRPRSIDLKKAAKYRTPLVGARRMQM